MPTETPEPLYDEVVENIWSSAIDLSDEVDSSVEEAEDEEPEESEDDYAFYEEPEEPEEADEEPILDISSMLRPRRSLNIPSGSEYVERVSDYTVKFEGCFAVLGDDLIKISGFDTEEDGTIRIGYKIYNIGLYTGKWTSLDEVIGDINFTLPTLGAVNCGDSVVFTKRKHTLPSPARYRKGFRLELLDIFYPTRSEAHTLSWDNPLNVKGNLDRSIAKSIFFKKYYTFEEAMEEVSSMSRIAAAFSSEYYITLSEVANTFLLWRGSLAIGRYNKSSKKFKLTTNMFTHELRGYNVPLLEVLS